MQDATGAVIPNAKVTLTDEASKFTRTSEANGQGFFRFVAVPPATYDFEASAKGFESWTVTGIVVLPGDSYTIPKIKLSPGAVTASIEVTAEAAGVTLDSGAQAVTITAADIARLSTVGRDTAELISILPGFSLEGGSVNGVGENRGPDYSSTGQGSTNLTSFGSVGSAPTTGAVNVTSDGANLIDPGLMGGQLANVNMDQTQEVKVQTADFGADQAKGPVVIDAVGKSGGTKYHGGLYGYYRNYAMNSNDWEAKHAGAVRPQTKYYYPGGNVGGPVKIPGTSFNRNDRLLFWVGYEYYGQQQFDGVQEALVPSADMLKGDLSADSIGSVLNVDPSTLGPNSASCTEGSQAAKYSNLGAYCNVPAGSDTDGGTIVNGQIPTADIDPGIAAYERFWPKANRTPQPIMPATSTASGEVSDGYNWVDSLVDSVNGYQFHSRVDLNISDNNKLYATYQQEYVNYTQQTSSGFFYIGSNTPMPTKFDSKTFSHTATANLTSTAGATLTNELVASLAYFTEPSQYENRSVLLATGTAWDNAGYGGGVTGATLYGWNAGRSQGKIAQNVDMLPAYGGTWEGIGIPSLGDAYTDPSKGQYINKYSGNIADNLTKVYKTHTVKLGAYAELTANNGITLGSELNGASEFMRWSGCYPNQLIPANLANLPPQTTSGAPSSVSTGNEIGQFLEGCPLTYNQDTSDPAQNMRFGVLEGYATDEWKLNSKWTLTLGMRFSHMGPWVDRDGAGASVWEPSELTPHVLLTTLTPDPKSWVGFESHETNPSIPIAGVPTRNVYYEPRFGVAYDLFGNGKSVFRGGWGAYRFQDNVGFSGAAVATTQGKQTWSFTNSGSQCTFEQMFNTAYLPCGYYTQSSVSSQMAPFAVNAVDPNDDERSVNYNYNFTYDQSVPWKMRFEAAYVGSQSDYLLTGSNLTNQNVIPLDAFFGPDPVTHQVNPVTNIPNSGNDYRPYPNYAQIYVPVHSAWSNYNSLQVSLNKQAGSLIFGFNYTRSKTLSVRGYSTGAVSDPVDMHHDYGETTSDRPNVFNLTYSWQEGTKFHGNKLIGAAVNGWELSGIATWQSGPDLAVMEGNNFGFSGGATYTPAGATTPVSVSISQNTWLGTSDYNLQPLLTCNPRSHLGKNQYVNGNCFTISPQGSEGMWNLPFIPGPAYENWNMSVYKDFKISDRQNMQFRLSGFNFLNHPISSFDSEDTSRPLSLYMQDPTTSKYTTFQEAIGGLAPQVSNFGSTSWKAGERIVELGFKYNF